MHEICVSIYGLTVPTTRRLFWRYSADRPCISTFVNSGIRTVSSDGWVDFKYEVPQGGYAHSCAHDYGVVCDAGAATQPANWKASDIHTLT